ncbi:MAG: TIGR00725 family protein [Dehalococcoidia bacterium]|jgi:uncharacterized protein (TIGR00725 family)
MMISVVGGDKASADVLAVAEEVGRELAERGCALVCGGRGGIMEAACRGARSRGGHTIGILPTANRRDANDYVEFPVVTGLGSARNAIVALSGDAVIAIDGSYGTLSEIALALVFGKPVVSLASWSFTRDGHEAPPLLQASDARDAVEKAVAAAQATADSEMREIPANGD